ncbi:MAG: DinB family protein [Candidatus Acidiferrales bacterium]
MTRWICLATISLALPLAATAQDTASNPVSTQLRQVLSTEAKNIVAAAQEFPMDKYNYHPTPGGMTVGHTMAHIAQVNSFVCSKVGGATPPPIDSKIGEMDKEKLVAQLQGSMDFCKQAFAGLTDAKLGDMIPLFGGRKMTRFGVAMEVTNDLIDHYATLSVYLRLNDMLPPTARPGSTK